MRRLSHSHTLDIPLANKWKLQQSKTEPNFPQPSQPARKRTQAEQDQADEDARRKAMKDLVGSWNDRLQLISLITTFMASVEAGLLQVSAPDPDDRRRTLVAVSNACLMSALIIHLHASFISFVGAFFLVRFKVQEARREENKIEGLHPDATQPSKGSIVLDMAAKHITNSPETGSQTSNPHADIQPPVWSANPQLVQVGPFFRQPPMHLLSRCHFLCILAAVFGFALAISGILCLAWARQPLGVKTAVASVLALCLTSGFVVVFSNYDGSPFVYD